MTLVDVPLVLIEVSTRCRRVNRSAMIELAKSIAEIGLQHPIGVAKCGERYRLIHGRHRMAAYEWLQHKNIPAIVHTLDEMQIELATIDENLLRSCLTQLEEAKALKRRKAIYLALHPETAPVTERGGPGRGKKTNDNVSHVSFTADTASKTGKSRRTVERQVEIADKILEDVQEQIANSPVADSKSELKQLSELSEEQQRELGKKIAEGAESVSEALTGKKKQRRNSKPRVKKVADNTAKMIDKFASKVAVMAEKLVEKGVSSWTAMALVLSSLAEEWSVRK